MADQTMIPMAYPVTAIRRTLDAAWLDRVIMIIRLLGSIDGGSVAAPVAAKKQEVLCTKRLDGHWLLAYDVSYDIDGIRTHAGRPQWISSPSP